MFQLTCDQAQTVRDFFLATIWAEHSISRMLIKSVPADRLDYTPVEGGQTVSDLMWHIVLANHHGLSGICDAEFAPPPPTPESRGAAAVLDWDDAHFPEVAHRLGKLSGEDLLRPVDVRGSSRPAVEFLPIYLSLVLNSRSELSTYLRLASLQNAEAAEVPAAISDHAELTEEELTGVVGGYLVPMTDATSSVQINFTQATAHPTMTAGGTLGSLIVTNDPQINQIAGILAAIIPAIMGLGTGIGVGIANAAQQAAMTAFYESVKAGITASSGAAYV